MALPYIHTTRHEGFTSPYVQIQRGNYDSVGPNEDRQQQLSLYVTFYLFFSLQWTNKLVLEWNNSLQPFVSIFTNSIIISFINSTNRCNSLHTLKRQIKQCILCYSYYSKEMRSHTIPLQIKTHARVPKVSQGQLLQTGVQNYKRQIWRDLKSTTLLLKIKN